MSAVLQRCIRFQSDVQIYLHHLLSHTTSARAYAKKIVSKVSAQTSQKSKPEVENDPEKLLMYCCGANIYADGNDPTIRSDSEYPEWLWTLRTERCGVNLSELDPNTASYWKRLSRINHNRNIRIRKRLQKLKEFQFSEDKK